MPKSGLPRSTYSDPYSQRIAATRAADDFVERENLAFEEQGVSRGEAESRKSWAGAYENALIRSLQGGPFGGDRGDYAALLEGDDVRLPSRPSAMTTYDPAQAPDPERFNFEKLFDAPQGEPLPSDGPNDDRTDAAMEGRLRAYRQADDLNWLLEGSDKPMSRKGVRIPFTTDPNDPLRLESRRVTGLAGAAAIDMGGGVIEGPRQVVGGMRDAVQSIIDMGEIGDEWNSLGGFRWNPSGGIAGGHLEYLSGDDWQRSLESGETVEPDLPTVGDPRTVTGRAMRAITQFMRSRRV